MSELKLIAIADIHGRLNQVLKIAEISKNRGVDAIIVSGDLSRYKSIEEARKILEILKSSGVKVFYVPGNMDDERICSEIIIENVECVHEKKVEFKGYIVMGVGGALIGPFSTPFELSEEDFLEKLKKISTNNLKNVILVTHNPPYNTKADKLNFNEHVGSKSLRLMIERLKPKLNVCGHIHEARSVDKMDGTIIVNPGPLMYNYYSEIYLGENVDAKLLRIL